MWSQTGSGGAEEGLRPLRQNPGCRSPAHRFGHIDCTIPPVHPASSAGWCKGKWINGLALFPSSGVTWEARREQICSHDRTCPLSTLHEIATANSQGSFSIDTAPCSLRLEAVATSRASPATGHDFLRFRVLGRG